MLLASAAVAHYGSWGLRPLLVLAISVLMFLFVAIPSAITSRRRRQRAEDHEAAPVFDEAARADAGRTAFGDPESLRLGRWIGLWVLIVCALVMALIGVVGLSADSDPAMKWVGFGLAALFAFCVYLMARALRRFAPSVPRSPLSGRAVAGLRLAATGWVVVGVVLCLVGAFAGLILMTAETEGLTAWSLLIGIPAAVIGVLSFLCAGRARSAARTTDPARVDPHAGTVLFAGQAAVFVAAVVAEVQLGSVLNDVLDDDRRMFSVLGLILVGLVLASSALLLVFRSAAGSAAGAAAGPAPASAS